MSAKEKSVSEIEKIRHSLAHILAMAVLERWPSAKLGVGPTIMNGFYYDFELPEPVSPEDLPDIESRMRRFVKQNLGFRGRDVSFEEAREFFQKKNQPYKLNLIGDLEAYGTTEVHEHEEMKKGEKERKRLSTVTLYQTGNFVDLCRGGHVENTKEIDPDALRLTKVAGAYWRGSEQNPMLTRIYGVAFRTKKELDEYFRKLEEADKRDHRKIGAQLGIYLFSDLVGPGLPLYTPKGGIIIGEIEAFMRQLQSEMGYGHVYTPHLAKEDLFQTSGHLQWFKEGMYPPMVFEGEGKYYAKPMNCPLHIQIYKEKIRSYRDLPIRYAEFGTVYRYEKSGTLGGLLRTRGFTQDDAHIFCREDQVVDEFIKVFEFTGKLLKALGLKKHWHRLSLPGPDRAKYAGNPEQWEKAIALIKQALKKKHIPYREAPGEAAFYGPKLDILFTDSLDRDWQITTIQVDFLLPERFDLTYIDRDGQKKRPYMIHRAPLGSRERIMAVLLEHHAGALPVWLSPVQAVVIPVGTSDRAWAKQVGKKLSGASVRVEVWDQNETVPKKIRDFELQKIPHALVVGPKEKKAKSVRVRERKRGDIGMMKLKQFLRRIQKEIHQKK